MDSYVHFEKSLFLENDLIVMVPTLKNVHAFVPFRYSLRSLVLHKLLRPHPLYRQYLKDMSTLYGQMTKIWRRRRTEGWDMIGHRLEGIWKIRSLMVFTYLKQNPHSEFYDVFEPLILDDKTTAIGLHEVRDDWRMVTVTEIDTLLGIQKPKQRELGCCPCTIS